MLAYSHAPAGLPTLPKYSATREKPSGAARSCLKKVSYVGGAGRGGEGINQSIINQSLVHSDKRGRCPRELGLWQYRAGASIARIAQLLSKCHTFHGLQLQHTSPPAQSRGPHPCWLPVDLRCNWLIEFPQPHASPPSTPPTCSPPDPTSPHPTPPHLICRAGRIAAPQLLRLAVLGGTQRAGRVAVAQCAQVEGVAAQEVDCREGGKQGGCAAW